MSTTMTRIDSQVLSRALERKPHYLSATGFISQLIEQALDSTNTLGKTQPAGQVFTSTNKEEKEERVRVRVRDKAREGYTPEFQKFWKTYQACTHKANSQSKPKAFEHWRTVTKDGNEAQVQSAIEAAIAEIKRRKAADEFAAPLPDCFRWLRDGHYEVHNEGHSTVPGFTPEELAKREAFYAELDRGWGVNP